MQINQEKIKYILYARRSSENEDRQIQSIEDQISRMMEIAQRFNLKVVETISESHSAKEPEKREEFKRLLKKIRRGEANGILCWHFNRLSRNPKDSGDIQWLLQEKVLKSIQTYDKHYGPEDNLLLLAIEGGMSAQFIQDLRRVSMRGMEGKADRGWLPSRAPLGYINKNLELAPDDQRFQLVRRMWDMLLSGAYTAPQILDIATKQWGLKTPKWNRSGGKEISTSGVYRIFSNLFYTGDFEWKGKVYKGKHQPMITKEEFYKAQDFIGREGNPRYQKHFHPYTGAIKCNDCGCLHTAAVKLKKIKKTGEMKRFVYYYCTRKRKDIVCTQTKTLTQSELEDQICSFTEQVEIAPEFLQWALDHLRENNEIEIEDKEKIRINLETDLKDTKKQLSNLEDMLSEELISKDSYKEKYGRLKTKIETLEQAISPSDDRARKMVELTQKTFHFATYAHAAFIDPNTPPNIKREIFLALGWNCVIKDQKLSIEPFKWLEPIKSYYPALKAEYDQLELDESLTDVERNERLASIRSTWGA